MTAPAPLKVYAPHLRISASGVFQPGAAGTPYEAFSYRVNLSNPTPVGGQANFSETRANDYIDDTIAFHASVGARIGNSARLLLVKVANIGSNGKYLSDPRFRDVNVPGAGPNQITHAPQVALGVSLVTARRGATGRGRFYLPLPSTIVTTAGVIQATEALEVATAVQTWFANLHNIPGLDPANVPRVTIASSKGYNSDVTGVRVGVALDTIRSRRTSLVEAYSLTRPV